MTSSDKKSCFVIAPIGEPESIIRRHSDQVLRHIIRPAVELRDYYAVRADEIAEPGVITSQIMQRVIGDDLVVADLTGLNPNVLYELAVRHAILKPFVQIITQGETIPFDVSGLRTVFFDLQDPDSVADSKEEIARQIEALERDSSDLQTPISIPLELQRIRQSADSDTPGFQEILSVISDIASTATANRSDIQHIREAMSSSGEGIPGHVGGRRYSPVPRYHLELAMESGNPYGFIVLVSSFQTREPWVYELGREAFRLAISGNIDNAGEVFRGLLDLIHNMSRRTSLGSVRDYTDDLIILFERMVSHVQAGTYRA